MMLSAALCCYLSLCCYLLCYLLLSPGVSCCLLFVAAVSCSLLLFADVCCCLLLFAAVFCQLLLFPAICCYLLLLAMNRCNFVAILTSICCCLPVCAYAFLWKGLPPKSTLDGPKIDHLGTQKSLKNRWKIDQNWFWELPGPPPGQVGFNLEALGRFLVIFGTPLRAPKQPKINPWPKKWSQGPRFHQLLLHIALFLIFQSVFA